MGITSTIDVQTIVNLAPELFRDASPYLLATIGNIYGIVVTVSIPVCVLLVFGIFYSHFSMKVVQSKISKSLEVDVDPAFAGGTNGGNGKGGESVGGDVQLTARWRKILELVDSQNQNDWVRAIMEADIMLEEVLDKAGYHGEGIGEKLKNVERGDMENLDSAWEAHKIRNALSHEANYVLNQHEAKRTIEMFRKVFAEYYVI